MIEDNSDKLNESFVEQLRLMAVHGLTPADILRYLRNHVHDRYEFENYMLEAFSDDGIVWTVASRWWHDDISSHAANIFLEPIFKELLMNYSDSKNSDIESGN